MRITRLWFLLAPFILVPVIVRAEPANEWEKVDALPPGTRILVTLMTGEHKHCRFRHSGREDLTVFTAADEETLPKSIVRRIVSDDPVRNGVVKGALAGAAFGTLVALAGNESCGSLCDAPAFGAIALPFAAIFGGAGAALGYVADRGRVEVLFPPLATPPTASPRVRAGATLGQGFTGRTTWTVRRSCRVSH